MSKYVQMLDTFFYKLIHRIPTEHLIHCKLLLSEYLDEEYNLRLKLINNYQNWQTQLILNQEKTDE